MSPRRFCFVIFILAAALASALFFHGNTWRGIGFPVIGLIVCFLISANHVIFSGISPPVGKAIKRGVISSTPSSEKGFFWAGESLSMREACQHFLVVGATGSGKSITLNLLMQSVFNKFGTRNSKGEEVKRRALVYDSKADLVSVVAGLAGGMERLCILNPLDVRFRPWDTSTDVTTEADANSFATMLIAKNQRESSPYFTDTARSLVAGVIKRFISNTRPKNPNEKRKARAWELRDVILAFESKEQLRQLLDHPETHYLQDHFSEENAKNFAGVKSTVDTSLAAYRTVAALLHASPNPPISIKEWVENGESILVLGNHELAREATDTLNRLILQQVSKTLIARDGVIEQERDQTFIFLDELREAGALQGLRQLLLRGRSKSVSVAMGFQDVEGIYAAYGEHEGAEIIGAAQNLIALHINPSAPKTAVWCSSAFSSRRDELTSTSEGGNKDWGLQHSPQLVPNVYPIQFVQLPMPPKDNALNFFSYTNDAGYRLFNYPWLEFVEKEGYFSLPKPEKDFQLQRDEASFSLKPWGTDDRKRLDFTPQPTPNRLDLLGKAANTD